jgi:hypothetical protein
MGSGYLTVVIDDLPFSVVRTESHDQAVAVTMRLRQEATGVPTKRSVRRKAKNCGSLVRCRVANPREISTFQERNINWHGARLLAVLL